MRSEEALRLALRSFARTVDVEAVIQEAALRLWQLAPRIEPDGKPNCLLRWTITVARNLARDLAARCRTTSATTRPRRPPRGPPILIWPDASANVASDCPPSPVPRSRRESPGAGSCPIASSPRRWA
jgi:DNA-directed RNA polymerase specialized sigma24 family protein